MSKDFTRSEFQKAARKLKSLNPERLERPYFAGIDAHDSRPPALQSIIKNFQASLTKENASPHEKSKYRLNFLMHADAILSLLSGPQKKQAGTLLTYMLYLQQEILDDRRSAPEANQTEARPLRSRL